MGRRAPVEEDVADPLEGLTLKERRFVDAYLGEAAGNGTRAARLAGYGGSSTVLGQIAYENLRKPDIREAIARLTEDDELVLTRTQRLRLLSRIGRREEPAHHVMATGEVVEIPTRVGDQLSALKTLSELAGDFRELDKADDGLPPDLSLEQLFDLAGIPRGEPEQPPEPH